MRYQLLFGMTVFMTFVWSCKRQESYFTYPSSIRDNSFLDDVEARDAALVAVSKFDGLPVSELFALEDDRTSAPGGSKDKWLARNRVYPSKGSIRVGKKNGLNHNNDDWQWIVQIELTRNQIKSHVARPK